MAITKKLRVDLQDMERELVRLQDFIDALSDTELGFIDGVVAGTVAASKALVVDSNKDLASLRHLTLTGNLVSGTTTLSEADLALVDGVTAGAVAASKAVVADSSSQVPYIRKYVDDGANVVLTAAQSGAFARCDKTDGFLFTLPTPVVGLTYKFVWDASWASGEHKIITNAGSVFIKGTILKMDIDTLTDPLSVETYNGTNHIAVLINAATDGGLLGSWLELTCISATLWSISGVLHHSGNVSASASTS